MLDEGEAGIIHVGETTLEQGIDKLLGKASRVIEKEIGSETKILKVM